MSGVQFGSVTLCRRCDGVGRVRHARDPEATRERERQRAQGETVPEPPSTDPCPVCHGAGLVPLSIADRETEAPDESDPYEANVP